MTSGGGRMVGLRLLRRSNVVDGGGHRALVETAGVELFHFAGNHGVGGRVASTLPGHPRPSSAAVARAPVPTADDGDDDGRAESDGHEDGGDDRHHGHGLDRVGIDQPVTAKRRSA